jgi:inner membrane protein
MPSIISHTAPVICVGLALGRVNVPWRLLAAGLVFSILPDLDVVGVHYSVAYGDAFGHRGLTHSIVFALGSGLSVALLAPFLRYERNAAFIVCSGAVATHILLDSMTNGGLGVALSWPFSKERFFFPWRPIEVSPFPPQFFLFESGLEVLRSEALYVWLPSFCAMALIGLIRWLRAASPGRAWRSGLQHLISFITAALQTRRASKKLANRDALKSKNTAAQRN